VEGQTVDVGSGELVSIRSLVEQLVALTGARVTPQFGALGERPMEQVRVADAVASYERLGWRPATTLAEGLRHTVDWFARRQEEGRAAEPVARGGRGG
jgi:nucleoside-diphosphate-sugar epimerase